MRIGSLIIAAIILAACSVGGVSDTTAAAFYCEEAIKTRLKAPATAKFSGQFETGIEEVVPDRTWRVRGYVDAQNSFGATLRRGYDCTISGYGAPGQRTWTVSDLRF